MKKNKKYRITLNEAQIGLVQKSLKEYFRLRMGQYTDFADDIASLGVDLSPENPDHKRIFDKFLMTRDHIAQMMSTVFRVAFGVYGTPSEKNGGRAGCGGSVGCNQGVERIEPVGHSVTYK